VDGTPYRALIPASILGSDYYPCLHEYIWTADHPPRLLPCTRAYPAPGSVRMMTSFSPLLIDNQFLVGHPAYFLPSQCPPSSSLLLLGSHTTHSWSIGNITDITLRAHVQLYCLHIRTEHSKLPPPAVPWTAYARVAAGFSSSTLDSCRCLFRYHP
jgi:hypothetical protein